MKISLYIARTALLALTLWAVTACTADPWPEPDSMERGGDNKDGEVPADEDVDDTGGKGGKDTSLSVLEILAEQVYCSAPNEDGTVTVVGLAGTFPRESRIEIVSASDTATGTAGQDGGLTVRLSASPGEPLGLSVVSKAGAVASDTIVAGEAKNGAVGTDILGDGQVDVYANGDVIITGVGPALGEDSLVVGGNSTRSTGRMTPLSCNAEGCMFGLLIPGASGEVIDLFLVTRDSRAGHTDVQTVVVP
jgi:hypothetical protein